MTAPTPDMAELFRNAWAKVFYPRDVELGRRNWEDMGGSEPSDERAEWEIAHEPFAHALAAVTAERDQARQMLADAPHGPHCSSLIPVPDPPRYGCDCWRAGL